MRSYIHRAVMAATFVFTVACSGADSVAPVTAPASASRAVGAAGVAPASRAIDQYVWVSCANGGAGEAVRVTGDLRYDMQLVRDASGVSHLNIKSNTSGLTAVGQATGTTYRGMMKEHVNSRAEDELNMDVRTSDVIRFVALGSRDAYSLEVRSRFVVDEGSYVLWEQTWDEACR